MFQNALFSASDDLLTKRSLVGFSLNYHDIVRKGQVLIETKTSYGRIWFIEITTEANTEPIIFYVKVG